MNIENIQPGNPGAPDDFTMPNGSPATNADMQDTSPDDELTASTLTDALQESIDDEIARADMNNPTLAEMGAVADDDMSTPGLDIVLQGDLLEDEDRVHSIHSPILDAPDTPGEVDFEALDERDLDGTPLPADARLDPIED
jgi:hypothetical protein